MERDEGKYKNKELFLRVSTRKNGTCIRKLDETYQGGNNWKKLTRIFGISLSTIQRLRRERKKPRQKARWKLKIDGNILTPLRFYISKHNKSD